MVHNLKGYMLTCLLFGFSPAETFHLVTFNDGEEEYTDKYEHSYTNTCKWKINMDCYQNYSYF
jgi:hypothetical protein